MTLAQEKVPVCPAFLLDQDNNILLVAYGENKDLKDRNVVIRLMEIPETRAEPGRESCITSFTTQAQTGLTVVGMTHQLLCRKRLGTLETTVLLIGIASAMYFLQILWRVGN